MTQMKGLEGESATNCLPGGPRNDALTHKTERNSDGTSDHMTVRTILLKAEELIIFLLDSQIISSVKRSNKYEN